MRRGRLGGGEFGSQATKPEPSSFGAIDSPHLLVSPHLLLLIGLPGSGKSFRAAELLRQDPKRRVISTDEIRSRLFGNGATQGPWLQVWREVGLEFRQAIRQIAQGEISEAIYDATNAVRRQRRKAIALARHCGFAHVTGIWVDTPVAICLERNQTRDRTVPLAVILKMNRSLVAAPPALPEGFDDLTCF